MIYPGIGELDRQDPRAEEGRLPLHQRHVHPQEDRRVQAERHLLLQRPPRRHARRATTSPSSARGSSTRRSTASRPPRRPVSSSARTPRCSRRPTWPSSTRCSRYLTALGVDGFMISPGYGYSAVDVKEIFMTRDDIREKFRAADAMFRKYKFNTSPIYLEFLQGKRELTLHGLGQPDPEHQGLEGPVLPDHRHPPRVVRRPLEQDRLGEVRLRQRPAVRALHDALGLRDVGRAGGQQQAGRHAQDDQVAVQLT